MWQKSKIGRNLAVVDISCTLALINCIKSQESTSAVLSAVNALILVLKDNNDHLISLCVRHKIVPIIKYCLSKQSAELKHAVVLLANKILST